MDQTEQFAPAGGSAFVLRTYDLQLQQNFALGSLQELLLGAGERINDYDITNTPSLLFVPPSRALTLGDVFIQDTLKPMSALSIVAGFKIENDPYSGWSPLPDLRVSWSLSDQSLLWAAASRSIRSPTPFDVDVQEKLGSLIYLNGNPEFNPEQLIAYQLGYRSQLGTAATLSISAYYNHYDDLRSVEFSPGPGILEWGNRMRGNTTGVETWADIQVFNWWRLSPGIRTTHEGFELEPGSSGLLGSAQAGNDPSYQASLTSSMDIGRDLTLDASLRYVSALPDPVLPGYYDLAARLGWQATNTLLLSLNGQNLLRSRHLEYPAPVGEYITRSVMFEARWQL